MKKCNYCVNYNVDEDDCDECPFEFDEEYYSVIFDDEFDVLDLDDDINWSHLQILDRIHSKNLPCLFADVWGNDMLYLVGCNVFTSRIAQVLGVHEECIYNDSDKAFIIVNLYQERCIRKREE